MRPYVVAVEGLSEAISAYGELPPKIVRFARMAINTTARRSRTLASREMRRQVAFTARYLSDKSGRLSISQTATDARLEARIRGRHRPTSLARFSRGGGRRGVRVQVKPGSSQVMDRAFFMPLRAGRAPIETRSNLGLAIRLRPGERLANKHKMIQVSGNLYLLYGPSVDQVFRTVAEDIKPEAADILQAEFNRLLDRLN
ncbi:hypothetical protein [Alterisphingorhabdus coralli]|uniref:Uncharacterized protein n=1 Tax=Alterisphingorhabdus coralli TaxID=3071408 RepID=A0AA97F8D1_9SPHN|nr:hypothetical protein [Parasphingorhabdus sp. SCSIO 66989]WOE76319.1 hypothetical protein RB602_06300 [Parasphingorhabdus sp. SCSIO 66989]